MLIFQLQAWRFLAINPALQYNKVSSYTYPAILLCKDEMAETKRRKSGILILILVLLASMCSVGFDVQSVYAEKDKAEGQVSLILTADMHAQVQPVAWTENGETTSTGGFAAVAAVIDQVRGEWPASVVLDGGSFSMGSPYQTIEMNKAPELTLMGQMGYDAFTFGDREFGFGPVGLASMLNNASKGGKPSVLKRVTDVKTNSTKVVTKEGWEMPKAVGTNIDWRATLEEEKYKDDASGLQTAFNRYGVQDYVVLERDGIRIAVFGLMGKDAIASAPDSGVVFRDPVDYAKDVVGEITRNDEADMIVCLSHSGIQDPKGDGDAAEDIELAKAIPEIDVILSAHTHTATETPITVGTTTIVSVGADTLRVGHLVLDRTEDGYTVNTFELLGVDDSVKPVKAIQKAADAYKDDITKSYFSKYGYKYDQVLAENETAFTPIGSFGAGPGEESLGDLIADAYSYAVRRAEGDGSSVDVTIVPRAAVSASLGEGPVTAADAYRVLSLGTGPDGKAGYPLVDFYLTGKELKTLADVDISVAADDPDNRLYFSGLVYSFNTHRMIYNRTMDHRLMTADGQLVELQNKKLYRVVTDLHTAETLKQIAGGSSGMLSVVPKDDEGHTVIEFDRRIIQNGEEESGELKAWYALASYIDAFEGDVIPSVYHATQSRKIDRTGLSPVQLLKQPNRFTIWLLFLILLPIALIVLIIILFRRHRHVQRGYKRSMFGSAAFRPNGGKPVFKGRKVNRKKLHKWNGRY